MAVEWNSSKALVPVKKDLCPGQMHNTINGSHLFKTYKQYGGFLGFGRGYYSRRNRSHDEMENNIDNCSGRMAALTNWSNRHEDNAIFGEKIPGNTEHALSFFPPRQASPKVNKDNTLKFENQICLPKLPICSLRSKQSVEPGQKTTGQTSICKKMCEDMCFRIVKEHPFIAPFLRRDLLQELQLEVSNEHGEAKAGILSNSANMSKNLQICSSVCQQQHPVDTLKCKATLNKRARSVSRSIQQKYKTSDAENAIAKPLTTDDKWRKYKPSIFRKTFDVSPECRRLPSTSRRLSGQSCNRKCIMNRSCSLSTKTAKTISETEFKRSETVMGTPKNAERRSPVTIDRSKTAATKRRMTFTADRCSAVTVQQSPSSEAKQLTAVTSVRNKKIARERTPEEIAATGSSVDPLKLLVAEMQDKHVNINNLRASQMENSKNGKNVLYERPVVEKDSRTSTEERITEIASALSSWGYPIKNIVEDKKAKSVSSVQQNAETNVQSECNHQLEGASSSDSKVLLNLFQTLASSEKNRKILRQISYVLKTGTREKTRLMSTKAKKIVNYETSCRHFNEKTGTHIPKGIYKAFQGKGWRKDLLSKKTSVVIECSESVKLNDKSKPLTNNGADKIEPDRRGVNTLPARKDNTLSPTSLNIEHKDKPQASAVAGRKQQKPVKFNNLGQMEIRRQVSDDTNIGNVLLTNNIRDNMIHTPGFQSQLQCNSRGQGDTNNVAAVSDNYKEKSETTRETASKTKHEYDTKPVNGDQIEGRIHTTQAKQECNNLTSKQPSSPCRWKIEKETKPNDPCGVTETKLVQPARLSVNKEIEVPTMATKTVNYEVSRANLFGSPVDGERLLKRNSIQCQRFLESSIQSPKLLETNGFQSTRLLEKESNQSSRLFGSNIIQSQSLLKSSRLQSPQLLTSKCIQSSNATVRDVKGTLREEGDSIQQNVRENMVSNRTLKKKGISNRNKLIDIGSNINGKKRTVTKIKQLNSIESKRKDTKQDISNQKKPTNVISHTAKRPPKLLNNIDRSLNRDPSMSTEMNFDSRSLIASQGLKRGLLLKKPSTTSKSLSTKYRKQDQLAEKGNVVLSVHKIQQQLHTPIEHRHRKRSESNKLLNNHSRGKMPVVVKAREHTSIETRSRFDQYLSNKKLTIDKRIGGRKKEQNRIYDPNKSRNKGKDQDRQLEAKFNSFQISDGENEHQFAKVPMPSSESWSQTSRLQITQSRGDSTDEDSLPISSEALQRQFCTQTCFKAVRSLEATTDSISDQSGQACLLETNKFTSTSNSSYEKNERLTKGASGICGHAVTRKQNLNKSSGFLKKSVLDDVVRNMLKHE